MKTASKSTAVLQPDVSAVRDLLMLKDSADVSMLLYVSPRARLQTVLNL